MGDANREVATILRNDAHTLAELEAAQCTYVKMTDVSRILHLCGSKGVMEGGEGVGGREIAWQGARDYEKWRRVRFGGSYRLA
jgi:hypothetical protein